jgi:soluble lytic murein transglycosylase
MKKIRHAFLFPVLFSALMNLGCAQNNSLQKKYGNDALYFMALTELKSDEKNAIRLLKEAQKKSSPLISRKASEKLTELGTVQEKISACTELYKNFPDQDSLLIALKELFSRGEFSRVVQLSEKIDYKNCFNENAYYRLCAMFRKKDSRFETEFFEWCTVRPFQNFHHQLYGETFAFYDSVRWKILEFRNEVFTRNYVSSAKTAGEILSGENFAEFYVPQILSDAGKSFLYGTKNSAENAIFLDNARKFLPDDCKFFADFYAARLYEKSGAYETRAQNRFIQAMEESDSDENFDASLWYYFNSLLKISAAQTISAVKNFADKWRNPSYFDGFFETLSVRLLSLHLWDDFFSLADFLYGRASGEISAKFSYISARLIQENFIRLPKEKSAEEMQKFFLRATEGGDDLYYRFLAMNGLNFSAEKIQRNLENFGEKKIRQISTETERLLTGYADFGLAEILCAEYKKSAEKISLECAVKILEFLEQCGMEADSIRLASYRLFSPDKKIPAELFRLAFPRRFKEIVENSCADFSQPEWLLYGLIRSESFFNPDAVSSAGAIGLTQLMESTASDVARKLKFAEFDLKDPATNIRFGSFYLEELRRRLENSAILAVLSYNGGISRVRSWTKSARLEFGMQNLPNDLFLEAIPFSETRGYGRKVISAAAVYAYLYYDKNPATVVEEMMK